jgi:LemA protein
MKMRKLIVGLLLVASAGLSGCGYNKIQNQDESVKAAWSEVVNNYQRRSDLIPNLVATVKGFAAQEERVLVEVTAARSKATSIQLTPELINDPAAFQKYQEAQGQLTSALSRLMVVVEKYPELKSNENFRDLQVQLEGTENRITVARKRYIDAVQSYNVTIREFPTNLTAKMFDYEVKQNFSVENEKAIATAPNVSFDTSTPSQSAKPVEKPAPATNPATN